MHSLRNKTIFRNVRQARLSLRYFNKLSTPHPAFWRGFTTQFEQYFGKPGKSNHMISDVVGDVGACLQMAPFSYGFRGVWEF